VKEKHLISLENTKQITKDVDLLQTRKENEMAELRLQVKQLKLINENNQIEINKLHQRLKDKKAKDLESERRMQELMEEVRGIYRDNDRIFREKEAMVKELERKNMDLQVKTEELEKFKVEFVKTWKHVDELDSKMRKMEGNF
jgi:hypothetical protein